MDRLVLQEVALLAIRKAGAILATLRRARGGAGGTKPASVAGLSEYAKALKDAKVPETTARYWQRVANASEGKLQAHLEWAKKDDREVTTAGLIGYQQHQSAEDIAACAAIPLTKAEQEAKARLGRLANRLFAVAHVVCAQSRILFDGTPQNELEIILSFEQLEKVVEVLEALGNDQRKRLLENAKGPPHIVCVFGPYDSRKRRKVSPGGPGVAGKKICKRSKNQNRGRQQNVHIRCNRHDQGSC